MRKVFSLLTLAAFAIPACAARYSLELKPENTNLAWTLGDVLHTVHGTFNLKSGVIDFETDTGAASGRVVIDVTSGDSGSDARDRKMHANVLESAKYPEAVFTPDRLEGKLTVPGTSNVKLEGVFLIHGVEHRMTMTVEAKATEDYVNASIAFDVPYVAWGMKDPSNFILKVNKIVQFSVHSAGALTKH